MIDRSSALTCALACVAIGACEQAELGPCDQAASLELVYDQNGIPAFAGQALVNVSCGSGVACHSEGIPEEDRLGAPRDLDLDLLVASTSSDPELASAQRLLDHQVAFFEDRAHLLWVVENGREPRGDARSPAMYERWSDGAPIAPLPAIDSDEGLALFRNWVSCGVPVVERTEPRSDRQPNVAGFTAPQCLEGCPNRLALEP